MNTRLLTAHHWRLLAVVALFFNVLVWGCALLRLLDRF